MSQSLVSRILSKTGIFVIFAFMLLPVFMVIWISMFKTSAIMFPPKAYSLQWYAKLLDQENFLSAFLYSLEISIIAMLISLLLGLLSAIAITHFDFRGKPFLQSLFLSPMIVPAIITGIAIYIFMFNLGQSFGVNFVPSTWSLIGANVVISLPWTVRLLTAGLQGVSKSQEEAAIDLGANRFKAFWYVTLPAIRPSLVAAGIISFIFSFDSLELSLMLVSPGKSTLPIEILNYVFWKLDPLIAAVSTVQIVIVGILMVIADRFVGLSKVF